MSKIQNTSQLFSTVLKLGFLLALAVAVVGGAIAYFFAGLNGIFSALAGASLALLFVSLTSLSVWIGGRLPLGGFFGVVMGGWLVKLISFVFAIAILKDADWVVGPVLFFTLVASVLGSLVLDAVLVLRAKIPTFETKN
jgi:hypothetical protein